MSESYSINPAEIAASIRALPLTMEALENSLEDTMQPKDRADLEMYLEMAQRGHPTAITVYRRLVCAYPGIPSLKNYLYMAYSFARRKRQAQDLLEETFRKHPDYLFALVTLAIRCIECGNPAGALPYLGESLEIPALPPGRDCYHQSEVRSYYIAVAMFHLAEDRIEIALAIRRVLKDLLGADNPGVLQLGLGIGRKTYQSLQQRIEQDEARAIRVEVPTRIRKSDPGFLPPSFHHSEVEALYHHGFDLPPSVLGELLALPRASLIADLEAVLHDARERGVLFIEGRLPSGNKETFFPLHAIFLLGELAAVDSLPRIYDLFTEDEDSLEFWFGDILGTHLSRPVRQLIPGRFDEAEKWVLAAGRPAKTRSVVARAIAELALADPGYRPEALAWFDRVMRTLVDATPGDGVLDTLFVTDLVYRAMDMRAVELRPLVEKLYGKGLVAIATVGPLADYDGAMAEKPKVNESRPLPPLADCYASILGPLKRSGGIGSDGYAMPADGELNETNAAFMPPRSGLDLLSASLSGQRPAPVSDAPKVGRNDPCPCGSGRKFKKCCG